MSVSSNFRRLGLVGVLAAAGLIGYAAANFGGAAAQDPGDMDPAMQEQMAAWEAFATPNEHHEFFKKFEGKWKIKQKTWMTPDGEPMESEGSYESNVILGGRYMEGKYKGEFMGQPFEGLDVIGYDNYKKKYVENWIDSMGTGFYYSEGELSEDGDVLTMMGSMPDPATGNPIQMKSVMTCIDEDTLRLEMYHSYDGENWMKAMELNEKRVK